MEKTAAMNKLANAVREYVQAEAQFNKVAAVAQQYAMEKNAQGILQRLGLQAAPVKSNMGRNAALAALLLGGLGAGAYAMSGKGPQGLDLDKLRAAIAPGSANKSMDSIHDSMNPGSMTAQYGRAKDAIDVTAPLLAALKQYGMDLLPPGLGGNPNAIGPRNEITPPINPANVGGMNALLASIMGK